MRFEGSPNPCAGHCTPWLWSRFTSVVEAQQTPVAGFLFMALPKESTSPAPYQSLTDAGPLPGSQGHAALGEGFPDS